jgi:hypothetical protein
MGALDIVNAVSARHRPELAARFPTLSLALPSTILEDGTLDNPALEQYSPCPDYSQVESAANEAFTSYAQLYHPTC